MHAMNLPISAHRPANDAAYPAAIVQSSDDAIVSKTLEGIIESWNDAATIMYGYTAKEAIGQPIEILIPVDRRQEELEIRQQIRAGIPDRHKVSVRRGSVGTLIPL